MKDHDLQSFEKLPSKKPLKLHFELNLSIFKKEKMIKC